MMLYRDDDSASRQLSILLRKAGHVVSIPADLGISGAADATHLTQAIRSDLIVLTRNARDFTLLHELVMASGDSHPGILLLHFDNDPTRDLTPRGTVAAISRLANSGIRLSNELHVLNHWR